MVDTGYNILLYLEMIMSDISCRIQETVLYKELVSKDDYLCYCLAFQPHN